MKAHIKKINYNGIILFYFEEYKKFVLEDILPCFDIILFDFLKLKNTTKAFMSCPDNKNTNYKLKIAKQFVFENSIQTKALLFHEFTHLYDHYKLTPNIYGEQGQKECEFYSEAHASIVKLMACFKFKNINDIKTVKLEDEIYFGNNLTSFEIFMMENQKGIIELMSSMISNPTEKEIERIIKHIMYYYGYLCFCQKFVKGDFSQFEDLSTFESVFGNKIIEAYNIIEDFDGFNLNKIRLLQEIRVYIKGFACYRFLSKDKN